MNHLPVLIQSMLTLIKDELLGLWQKGTSLSCQHRMESVEELCTHIALINKSKKFGWTSKGCSETIPF